MPAGWGLLVAVDVGKIVIIAVGIVVAAAWSKRYELTGGVAHGREGFACINGEWIPALNDGCAADRPSAGDVSDDSVPLLQTGTPLSCDPYYVQNCNRLASSFLLNF